VAAAVAPRVRAKAGTQRHRQRRDRCAPEKPALQIGLFHVRSFQD
jgi:hypothetical protein